MGKFNHILSGMAAIAFSLLGACSAGHSSPEVSVELVNISELRTPNKDLQNFSGMVERFIISNSEGVEGVCFTQLPRPMKAVSEGDTLIEINAGLYCIRSARFGSAQPITVDVLTEWPLRAVAECPESFYAIDADSRVIDMEVASLPSFTQAALADPEWQKWMLPADSIYSLNERIRGGKAPGPFDIVPSFKRVTLSPESVDNQQMFHEGLPIEKRMIADASDGHAANPEFYRITLRPDGALIEGASDHAITMAERTLQRRLLEPNGGQLPCAVIEDWPDLPYRGLMIDIARNYQSPEDMRKLVDLMADYRFNRLHFHVTDDEGWRLEIPGLPELTEISSKRGFTTSLVRDINKQDNAPEVSFLPDIFAGTGHAANNLPTANGYFSRRDYIDFLRYCHERGITVIPEVESPGHARAAIMAMESRFHKTGDDTYRLIDPNDSSRYTSAQLYHDNLMNPAVAGTYRFIAKVVDEIAAMYKEAGIPLAGIHLGGDEVPEGAWDGSAAANAMATDLGINGRHAMQGEYVKRIASIMKERGIPLYGWQDICTDYDNAFHSEVAPAIGGMDCWVSSHDPEQNIAIKGVRAGYPVILSNVDYFYMDMLYTPHPEERGLYWGGIVDEFKSLSGYPEVICPSQPGAPGKVIGVSGKLFAETIRSRQGAEKLLFPKSFGLAERGWNATPTYSDADFNILIGKKELPRLSRLGTDWHLRQPGIRVADNQILLNSPYPDAEIRYTTDGSTPTPQSPLYSEPLPYDGKSINIRAILVMNGKTSVVTILHGLECQPDPHHHS